MVGSFICDFINRAAEGGRGSRSTRGFFNRAAWGRRAILVLHGFFFFTAQPQACAGLVLHVVLFFF